MRKSWYRAYACITQKSKNIRAMVATEARCLGSSDCLCFLLQNSDVSGKIDRDKTTIYHGNCLIILSNTRRTKNANMIMSKTRRFTDI